MFVWFVFFSTQKAGFLVNIFSEEKMIVLCVFTILRNNRYTRSYNILSHIEDTYEYYRKLFGRYSI